MKVRKVLLPIGAAAALAIGVGGFSPAGATVVPGPIHFLGWAGGSLVRALGTTISSDLTSESSVDTISTGITDTNTLATVTVPNVLTVGAINSDASTVAITGGVEIITHARTANVSLLGGAVTIQAVDTTDTATIIGDITSSKITTTFVGIHIAGVNLPITIPQNFNVNIPGVAQLVLNGAFSAGGPAGSQTLMTTGEGLYLSLLKPVGNAPVGTQIYLNPTYAAVAPTTPVTGADIGGYAYGSQIQIAAGQLLNAKSGPTAQISQPIGGTGGKDQTNGTLTVNLSPIATVGALTDTANGLKSATGTNNYSTMTTKLAGINLFNGLITADALTGVASVAEQPNGTTLATATTSLVNLVIAGKAIPVNVSPNTVINVANLGLVTIREQATSSDQALVKVLDIKISTAGYGLPVGAEIEVGVAAAWVITAAS